MASSTGDLPPLAGTRVIDFGHYLAGPLTGMLLADQGAEVIKVDRPGQPACATPAGAVCNRGKQTLELDLKSAAGRAAALQLVASADVVIENFRPGVMERLGLGPAAMLERNPRLVYLSLPGFFSTEEAASLRAFEGILGAATGLFTDLHSIRRELQAPPQYTPVPLASAYGAIHGALAVTLALYAREESGRGEVIEVPLAGAAMSAMGAFLLRVGDPPARYGRRPNPANQPLRERMQQADAAQRRQQIEALRSSLPPMFDSYQAADGAWVFLLAGGNRRHAVQLVKALGIYDELIAAGMIDQPTYADLSWRNNLQDVDHLSPALKQTLRESMDAAFRRKPAAEWTAIMRQFGVPFSVHRTTQEWLQAPETAAAALTVVVEDPEHGPIRQLGVQTSLGRTADRWLVPQPARRGDLAALLRGNGQAPARAPAPEQILAGIKVLDLSTVLAGPCCARTLAEYGAEVIKIDTPTPYFGPSTTCMAHIEVSQGKRSMILDLAPEAGKQIFRELAADADVIVHNFRPGVAERLQIDYPAMARVNPEIVYLNLTAFNGPRPGPWTDLPGFDPVLQAATGIMSRYGGPGERPELHGFASCIDYLTGYSGTFGIALALLRRKRSGGGDLVLTSLAQGAQLVQAPFMWSTAEGRPDDGPQGQEALGTHSLERIYRAADGWLFLAGLAEDLPRLRTIPELEAVPIEASEEAARILALEAAIAGQPREYWERAFNAAGLGCHRVDSIEDIRHAGVHELRANQCGPWDDGATISVIRMLDHPVGSPADTPAPTYARLANSSLRLTTPMPKVGSDTRAILREYGHDDAQIDTWIAAGLVQEQLHDAYLPH